jgi:hypothetical protein
VRPGTAAAVLERKEVPLEALVAQLARVEEVGPLIRQPVVARAFEFVGFSLLIASLRAEVLDVAVADVGNEGLAERALVVLCLAEGVLDLFGRLERTVKVAEGPGAALEIVGR